MMIRSHGLTRAIGPLRRSATPENCKIGLSIGGGSVARCLHVAKNLVVGAIFLDDINDVFDRALADKKFGGRKSHQAVILQSLLRVPRQCRQVRQRNPTNGSRNNLAALMPAPASLFFLRLQRGLRSVMIW